MIELPVSACVAAAGWRLFSGSLDVWGRTLAAATSVAAVALMYLLVRRWHGHQAALAAGWMLALSPVSIVYGQSFMLEPSIVLFTLAAIFCWDHWLNDRRPGWLGAAALSLALLLLTKVYMLTILLPLTASVMSRRARLSVGRIALSVFAIVVAVLPGATWYAYAWLATQPGGELAQTTFFSLHDAAGTHQLPSPLWFSADFYRQLLDDLAGPTLTSLGLCLTFAGLASRGWRRHLPWLASMAMLVALLPLKFYKMNYYDLVVLPPLCVMVGLGWQVLQSRLALGRKASIAVLGLGLLLALRYAAVPAFFTPAEDRGVLAAAASAARHLPAGEPVATLHGTSFDLLYYCDRPGWALAIDDPHLDRALNRCRAGGARLLVIANLASLPKHPAATAAVSGLPLIEAGDDFRIYRLMEPSSSP